MRNVARVASEGTRLSENRQTIKQGGGQEGAFEKEIEARCFLTNILKMHVWRTESADLPPSHLF